MEDDMEMLFRLSQPIEVRNLNTEKLGCTFWSDLGLKNFSGLGKDLMDMSSTTQSCHVHGGDHLRTLYLVSALRMSRDCPFLDIRQKASGVLQFSKEKGISIPVPVYDGPTKFISPAECPRFDVERIGGVIACGSPVVDSQFPVELNSAFPPEISTTSDNNNTINCNSTGPSINMDKAARLLSEAFLSSGRIDHALQLMAYHPDYLDSFLKTHNFLLRGDGPLPFDHRHYIAIMAAARYQCTYLMELQKREFLYQGGDPQWLRGLDAAPSKLTSLYYINKMMAHRPWVLKKEDFLHLTKKAGWSLSEVVHAVVLLAHFHALSSFIHGCGITPEIDFDKGHTYLDPVNFNSWTPTSPASTPTSGVGPTGNSASAGGSNSNSSSNSTVNNGSSNNNGAMSTTDVMASMIDHHTGSFHHHHHHHPSAPHHHHHHSSPHHLHHHQQQHHHLNNVHMDELSTTPSTASTSSSSALGGGLPLTATTAESFMKNDKTEPETKIKSAANNNNNNIVNHNHSGNHTTTTTSKAGLLKNATHHNSLTPGAVPASPPKKGALSSVSEVDTIMATMKNLSETSPIEDPEERKKRFETVASSDDSHEKENVLTSSTGNAVYVLPEVSPFINDPTFTYEDFAKRGQVAEMHTFRIQDYSWEEQGFSLVNRLYADIGNFLDEKFKVAKNMTYYTMGGRAHVDTSKFRTAVWNYIQCLYGIRHDDYDYGEVNQLLERPLKSYVKTVCCYPERVTRADYDNVMREFKHSEKVHVNLMIMEAKIQAELLYALRTIMKFIL